MICAVDVLVVIYYFKYFLFDIFFWWLNNLKSKENLKKKWKKIEILFMILLFIGKNVFYFDIFF